MEEKILEVLEETNEEIITYTGDNMLEDGVLDSFQVMDMIADLEDALDIEIDAKYVVEENFRTKDTIIALLSKIMEQ